MHQPVVWQGCGLAVADHVAMGVATAVRVPTGREENPAPRPPSWSRQTGEACQMFEEGETDLAGRSVAVFGDDDLGGAFVGAVGVVGVVAVDEGDDVGVLFQGA